MSKDERTALKHTLAAAIAEGQSCAQWASANGVAERTAQRWAAEPAVRALVESLYATKKARLTRVESRRRVLPFAADRSPWDWYAAS